MNVDIEVTELPIVSIGQASHSSFRSPRQG